MPQPVLDTVWYKTVIMWMQCAFGLMPGTELVWQKLKSYGKGLIVTTLTQSLGTFCFVTLVFAIVLWLADVPVYLAFLFGGIALATAPAPALSIVNEFHAKGPVTNTLLPMGCFHPILAVSLLAAIVDLGAPLNYHLILGAGFYTFLYIAARGAGKYFRARFGAKAMKMPETVQKYGTCRHSAGNDCRCGCNQRDYCSDCSKKGL